MFKHACARGRGGGWGGGWQAERGQRLASEVAGKAHCGGAGDVIT
jgi:hypothetical protein